MSIVLKFDGDIGELAGKLETLGVKFDQVGDEATGAGKAASNAFDSKLEQQIRNIEDATSRAAEATETLASHAGGMNSLAEGFGNTERLALGANDIMGVMAEQFGVNLGPAQEYAQSIGDIGGGLEGVIGGGMALGKQLVGVPAQMGPAIASTWAHVTALYAQAAAFIAANAPLLILIGTLALLAAGVFLVIQHWDDITAKFPILGEATDAIQAKLDAFTAWITDTFVPAVLEIYNGVKGAIEQAIAFVVDHWDEIRAFIQPAIEALTAIIQAQIDVWVTIFETVVGVIRGIFDVFMGVFTGDWERSWNGIKAIFQSVWDGITGIVSTGIELIKNLAPLMLGAAEALGGALKDGFISGVKGTIGVIGNLADGLLNAMKTLINSAIGEVNAAIPNDLSISIMGKSIGVDLPDNPIPRLASGMWNVPGPTGVDQFPALLAGGEMVLPAPAAEAFRVAFSADGGGGGGDLLAGQLQYIYDAFDTWVMALPANLRAELRAEFESRMEYLPSGHGRQFVATEENIRAMLGMLEGASASVPQGWKPPAFGEKATLIEDAMSGTTGWAAGQIPESAQTMYGLYRAGVISEGEMWAWLKDNGYSADHLSYSDIFGGAPPPATVNAPSGPHPERGGGAGAGVPVATGAPKPGDAGGTASGGGAPRVTPAGGVKADEELVGLVAEMVEQGKKSNILLSKLIDILGAPQVIDFMSRGDPRSLAVLLAPFLVDQMAQIYRRQWGT